ncbi:MAG TPA: AAA family ATPase [Nitriliruptorales bacterium]|nr:AAA family ATPase [Nitriliruptorales bacterium]
MRVAVVGKGGSGKTVVAALLARCLAERGKRVLAVDLDTNPGLALSLGLPVDDRPLPDEAVEQREGTPYGWTLAAGVEPAEAVRRYSVLVTDELRFLGFGNIAAAEHRVGRYLTAVRRVLDEFREPGWVTVADLEAGPATPFEGFTRSATLALLLAEATPASLMAARRIRSILDDDGTPTAVVVTKGRGADDVARVAAALGPPVGVVPWDPKVRAAERRGPLTDLATESPAARAVRDLAHLVEREEHREELIAG